MRKSSLLSGGFRAPRSCDDDPGVVSSLVDSLPLALPRCTLASHNGRLSGHFNANRFLSAQRCVFKGDAPHDVSDSTDLEVHERGCNFYGSVDVVTPLSQSSSSGQPGVAKHSKRLRSESVARKNTGDSAEEFERGLAVSAKEAATTTTGLAQPSSGCDLFLSAFSLQVDPHHAVDDITCSQPYNKPYECLSPPLPPRPCTMVESKEEESIRVVVVQEVSSAQRRGPPPHACVSDLALPIGSVLRPLLGAGDTRHSTSSSTKGCERGKIEAPKVEDSENSDLEREVEEERRMSEDLPFTPHVGVSPVTAADISLPSPASLLLNREQPHYEADECLSERAAGTPNATEQDDPLIGNTAGKPWSTSASSSVSGNNMLDRGSSFVSLHNGKNRKVHEAADFSSAQYAPLNPFSTLLAKDPSIVLSTTPPPPAAATVPSVAFLALPVNGQSLTCRSRSPDPTRTRTTFIFSTSCNNSRSTAPDGETSAIADYSSRVFTGKESSHPQCSPGNLVGSSNSGRVATDGGSSAIATPTRMHFILATAPPVEGAESECEANRETVGMMGPGTAAPTADESPPRVGVVECFSPPACTIGSADLEEANCAELDLSIMPQQLTPLSRANSCDGAPTRWVGGPSEEALATSTWYDLPLVAKHFFAHHSGIHKLYPWQHELLTREDLRAGGSLVYSMPTSGGKTLVAEISLLRCVLNRRRSCFFVLPYVSLAEEKAEALQHIGKVLGFTVDGHYGSTGRFPLGKAPAVYVCTIEKANSLLNHLNEDNRGDDLGSVVVDELHMLGEPRRGATLEFFLSKLLLLSERRPDSDPVQILGMSATIPNLPALAKWLRAACYEGSYRPVPLVQYSVVDGLVLRDGITNVRSLCSTNEVEQLYELATELPDASVLIFCASRQQCVDTASGLVRYMTSKFSSPSDASPGLVGGTALVPNAALPPPLQNLPAIKSLQEELEHFLDADTSFLIDLVSYAVAFHHGGLLSEERALIERAYRQRLVRILCCTSTLAAGVNLPARRVIFKTPYIGREFLTKARYLQMCGRAGRAGIDIHGESFLILRRHDRSRGQRLLHQELEPCVSRALEDASYLPRFLLESANVGLVSDEVGMFRWGCRLFYSIAPGPVDDTFLSTLRRAVSSGEVCAKDCSKDSKTTLSGVAPSFPPTDVEELSNFSDAEVHTRMDTRDVLRVLLKEFLNTLVRKGFLQHVEVSSAAPSVSFASAARGAGAAPLVPPSSSIATQLVFKTTSFGASSARSCFGIEEALLVREELDRLRHTGLILADDLHLCYFMVPLWEAVDCDWGLYRERLSRLDDNRQLISNLIGVDEYFVNQRAMGIGGPLHLLSTMEEGKQRLFIARRFYIALILADVLSEVPMREVEQRYNIQRGQLQNLMRSVSMFSSSITNFCHAMEWYSLEAVLASFVKRLGFGVKPDLLPLMEIKGVQPPRARALWNAGYRTPVQLASVTDTDYLVAKVKATNPVDSKAARFFTKRLALLVIRGANLLVQQQIQQKLGELEELRVQHVEEGPVQ